MAITRNFEHANRTVDFSDEVMELGNQFSFMSGLGMFTKYNIGSTVVAFDRIGKESVLVPQSVRGQGGIVKGQDDSVKTYQFNTVFHKHEDGYSKDDILNYRKPATAGDMETIDAVRLEKLTKLRRDMEQTHEYMMLTAAQGITTDGYGNTIVDMFTEFGVTRPEVDFVLGTATTDISAKIREVKRLVAKNSKLGAAAPMPWFLVDYGFFDALVSHADFKERYKHYINSGTQKLRDNLTEMLPFGGSMDAIEIEGVRFVAYNPEFQLLDGSTVKAITDGEGTAMINADGILRGYYAPSDRTGDTQGQELFAFEDTRPKGTGYDVEVQSSSLFMNTRPLTAVRLFSSN